MSLTNGGSHAQNDKTSIILLSDDDSGVIHEMSNHQSCSTMAAGMREQVKQAMVKQIDNDDSHAQTCAETMCLNDGDSHARDGKSANLLSDSDSRVGVGAAMAKQLSDDGSHAQKVTPTIHLSDGDSHTRACTNQINTTRGFVSMNPRNQISPPEVSYQDILTAYIIGP